MFSLIRLGKEVESGRYYPHRAVHFAPNSVFLTPPFRLLNPNFPYNCNLVFFFAYGVVVAMEFICLSEHQFFLEKAMLTRAISILFFLFVANLAQAGDCHGRTEQCYDSCTGSYVTIPNVDKCDQYYDPQKGCYTASGFCSESSGGSGSGGNCRGRVEQCFDSCTGSYVSVRNVNKCDQYYDQQKGCYKATGYCKIF